MSVLFGVFLYMGISSIAGIQFFDRLKLFFMPVKHHTSTSYVRRVSILESTVTASFNIVSKSFMFKLFALTGCDFQNAPLYAHSVALPGGPMGCEVNSIVSSIPFLFITDGSDACTIDTCLHSN